MPNKTQEIMSPCSCDFHIHSKYLGCANATMEIPAIVKECERLGVTVLAITDHLNSINKLPLHDRIREDIQRLSPGLDVYFGVELNFMGCDQGFAFSPEIKAQHGFQFAIGGIHSTYLEAYDIHKIVEIQHRHHLKTCQDPLVDVLVHPYWFSGGEFRTHNWPWPVLEALPAIPKSYIRELGQTAKQTGTAIEINACACLCHSSERYVKDYIAYLELLAEEGVTFALGSDAHSIGMLSHIDKAWNVARDLHLTEDRIWRPEGSPLAPRKA